MGVKADGEGLGAFDPAEAFELLGNETRMEILQRLWEAYDPFGSSDGLAFSELYEAVDIGDSGQFNYHLDRLRDQYVEQAGERYRLTAVGLTLVQSVIAGAGQEIEYEPGPLEATCRRCDAPVELTYDGIRVYLVCTECEGNFDDDAYPEGTLWGKTMPLAGVVNRSPESLFATSSFLDWPHKAMLTAGICPRCTGVLEQSIELCEDHDSATGPCEACGYTQPVQVNWLCTVCKYHAAGTPMGYVKNHPAVIAFRYEQGIDFGYPYDTSGFQKTQEEEAVPRRMSWDLAIRSREPLRLAVTVGYEGEAVELTLDGELAVTDVRRTEAP